MEHANLAESFNLGKRWDWVMSLEVGEHIPKEYEQIFIDNIVKHACKGIILSWAVVGQGGHNHINCQNNDYVIQQMNSRGLHLDQFNTTEGRKRIKYLGYFKNTLMVFKFNTTRCQGMTG